MFPPVVEIKLYFKSVFEETHKPHFGMYLVSLIGICKDHFYTGTLDVSGRACDPWREW